MFLFERLIGIGIYMSILVVICVLITYAKQKSASILNFYLFCLCVMAFFYKPYITGDLYRTYVYVDFFSDMNFWYFFENYAITTSIPMARILFWFVGKTGINELLPVISAFICYSSIFYIIVKIQTIFNISKKNVAYTLFFLMTTSIYISVIGGIRMMIALALVAFCFFREAIEKKFRVFHIAFYLIALLMHNVAAVVIAIRFFVMIFDSRKKWSQKIMYVVFLGILGGIFMVFFNNVMLDVFEKAQTYLQNDMHSDFWEYIMGALILILFITLLSNYFGYGYHKMYSNLQLFNMVMILSIIIAIIFCFEFSIFYRFIGHFAVVFSIPMLMVTLEKSYKKPSKLFRFFDFKSIFLILNTLIMMISCLRGSMSSLKFFEF